MSLYISGFIVVLVLALLVLAWIAYCMFVREKHKSEMYHYNISDLQCKNKIMGDVTEETKTEKKDVAVGVFVLPSRHKQKDNGFTRRPDYPERSLKFKQSTDRLIDVLDNDDVMCDYCYKDGIYEVDSTATCEGHDDV